MKNSITKRITHPSDPFCYLAERVGFEPTLGY